MISLTPAATDKIKLMLAKRGRGIGVKIGVKTTGCSGLAYVLEYLDNLQDDQSMVSIQQDSFTVGLETRSLPYLQGMTVDWVQQGLNEGFEFRNPNERDRCGCGESFRV